MNDWWFLEDHWLGNGWLAQPLISRLIYLDSADASPVKLLVNLHSVNLVTESPASNFPSCGMHPQKNSKLSILGICEDKDSKWWFFGALTQVFLHRTSYFELNTAAEANGQVFPAANIHDRTCGNLNEHSPGNSFELVELEFVIIMFFNSRSSGMFIQLIMLFCHLGAAYSVAHLVGTDSTSWQSPMSHHNSQLEFHFLPAII